MTELAVGMQKWPGQGLVTEEQNVLGRSWYWTPWQRGYREALSSLRPRSSYQWIFWAWNLDMQALSAVLGEGGEWWRHWPVTSSRLKHRWRQSHWPLSTHLPLYHSSYSLPSSHTLVKGRWMPESEEQFLAPHSEETCVWTRLSKT